MCAPGGGLGGGFCRGPGGSLGGGLLPPGADVVPDEEANRESRRDACARELSGQQQDTHRGEGAPDQRATLGGPQRAEGDRGFFAAVHTWRVAGLVPRSKSPGGGRPRFAL